MIDAALDGAAERIHARCVGLGISTPELSRPGPATLRVRIMTNDGLRYFLVRVSEEM